MTRRPPARTAPVPLVLLLALLAAALPGCNLMGWMAHGVAGGEKKRTVDAQYHGLEGKTVAVVVAADDVTQFRDPEAVFAICRALSARISDTVPGARVVDPKQVTKFLDENPYWHTLLLSRLIERLGVERLVYVDIVEYQTNEPGNAALGQGKITANIGVLEAEAKEQGLDPDQFKFSELVSSMYPEDNRFGVPDADRATIRLGLISTFSRDVVRLFSTHQRGGDAEPKRFPD